MGGSDDDSDDANLEADAELNRKVATVVAPLVKKLKRQRTKIDQLEEQVAEQRKEQGNNLPRMEKQIAELKVTLDEALERTRRDIGERVLHADHARVEVGLTSKVQSMESVTEDLRNRLAQQELLTKTLQGRLEDVDKAARRATEGVEERVATLRSTVSDESARNDSRRAELQLHISEVSAKLHAELVEARRELDGEMHKLHAAAAAAAKRTEVLERFAGLEEASGAASAKAERQQTQLVAMDELLGEVQATLRTRAAAADVSRLRTDVDANRSIAATADSLAQVLHEASAREAQWERRHMAVEHATTASMREVRQMSANLDELGSRLGQFALQVRASRRGMGPPPQTAASNRRLKSAASPHAPMATPSRPLV